MGIQKEIRGGLEKLMIEAVGRSWFTYETDRILDYLDEKNVRVKTQHQWGVLPHEWDTKWERLIDED